VDEIVALLGSESTRDKVMLALAEQDGTVTQFLTLLLQEEKRQGGGGDGSITITDTACKP
jgi:hypothetical protein